MTVGGNLTVSGQLGSSLNAGGNKVSNLSTPTASGDAATKGYVDALGNGGCFHRNCGATNFTNGYCEPAACPPGATDQAFVDCWVNSVGGGTWFYTCSRACCR